MAGGVWGFGCKGKGLCFKPGETRRGRVRTRGFDEVLELELTKLSASTHPPFRSVEREPKTGSPTKNPQPNRREGPKKKKGNEGRFFFFCFLLLRSPLRFHKRYFALRLYNKKNKLTHRNENRCFQFRAAKASWWVEVLRFFPLGALGGSHGIEPCWHGGRKRCVFLGHCQSAPPPVGSGSCCVVLVGGGLCLGGRAKSILLERKLSFT